MVCQRILGGLIIVACTSALGASLAAVEHVPLWKGALVADAALAGFALLVLGAVLLLDEEEEEDDTTGD